MIDENEAGRQPLLNDATIVLRAPTQVWSDATGDMGDAAIHGVYHADTRVLSAARLSVGGQRPETIATQPRGASGITHVALLRGLDDPTPDPRVRLERVRDVTAGEITERLVVRSGLREQLLVPLRLELAPDASSMAHVKAGAPASADVPVDDGGGAWRAGGVQVALHAPGARVSVENGVTAIEWQLTVPPHGSAEALWALQMIEDAPVVADAIRPAPWQDVSVATGDTRLARWIETSLADLDALRMTLARLPGEEFLAAGAPWFFTLFGRDSIWAARFLLPLGTELAASTLRVLAALQGDDVDAATAEQPGKIMHELRADTLEMPGEGISLPPLYYGTIDATALWVCLLHDAWQWGMPADQVEKLLPTLEAALAWLRDHGDSDGDGFLEYVDETGHGLANQGWKDSGDSVQWKDGSLAEGPIALCEVQGYAFEAAIGGAELLDAFERPGGDDWRSWAANLKRRFAEAFWLEDERGRYPAIALDARKRPVDTVTSNMGHLLGTGILGDGDAAAIAARLASPQLDSGYGLRTMSTESAGYWPLSYHGGAVWAHDTAIAARGLGVEGFDDEAGNLIRGLMAAAEGFDYRMPELHSGDAISEATRPVPYPAACRPQAWSAAASIQALATALGLRPDGDRLVSKPLHSAPAGTITLSGIRLGDRRLDVGG
ncbi:Glycogen debranching enzyme (alpha-1,6-glucosidase) [Paramicrobacterium humi]|uniref:Glycogen debranching enzyme (Alpha-1,6-glucosidase) n=1 Tax=Paramicrobacterium humi TaxID=640635 RepID=A0A1H4JLL4_9MICO|nr:glycogen debranching N-terminal domain-containing protein [Microbacterium humi]SEB47209.1 Glycogen debranching enzyme (alpha-1,6-glucosidase) [Microbacterium humi]